MTQTQFLILLGILVVLSAVLIASRRGGPRVTTIETRREEVDGE